MSNSKIAPERLVSRTAAANRLGVSTKTIDRLRDDGTIHTYRIRGGIRLDLDEIDIYIIANREISKLDLAKMRRQAN